MEFFVERYKEDFASQWNEFIDSSRNGTFLFRREYMDYHADRFDDFSLVVRDERSAIIAVFVAAVIRGVETTTITAHAGLTYGGLVMGNALYGTQVLEVMEAIAAEYRKMGFTKLVYKAIPHIFHRIPSEEDIYALFRMGATLKEVNLSSAMQCPPILGFRTDKRYDLNKGLRNGIYAQESTDFEAFHQILTDCLSDRHAVAPVHSAAELKLLAERFPANIKLYCVYTSDGVCAGGTVLFRTDTCLHSQYIATTPEGRRHRVLSVLFDKVISTCSQQWFDFGTSNEEHGLVLNEGLISQKSGFGARGVAYSIYELSL